MLSENRNLGIAPSSSGMIACCWLPVPRMLRGLPTAACKMPGPSLSGSPKPILKPHSTHTTSTRENPVKAINMVLTAHFFWTMPPYSTAMPGKLIKPTSVAATSCQALSPGLSQSGYGDMVQIHPSLEKTGFTGSPALPHTTWQPQMSVEVFPLGCFAGLLLG